MLFQKTIAKLSNSKKPNTKKKEKKFLGYFDDFQDFLAKNKNWVLLILIIILAAFLRFWNLDTSIALNQDEAVNGVDAWYFGTAGLDHHGNPVAPMLQSYNDWASPTLTFMTIPMLQVFGISVWTVRFVNAFFGVLCVPLVALLTLQLTKSKVSALFTAFVMAISPFAVHLSRWAIPPSIVPFWLLLMICLVFWATEYNLENSPNLVNSDYKEEAEAETSNLQKKSKTENLNFLVEKPNQDLEPNKSENISNFSQSSILKLNQNQLSRAKILQDLNSNQNLNISGQNSPKSQNNSEKTQNKSYDSQNPEINTKMTGKNEDWKTENLQIGIENDLETSLNNSKSTFEKSEKETLIENLDNFDKNNLAKKTQNPSQELTKKLTNQPSNIQTEKPKNQKSKNNSPKWFRSLWKFVLIGIAAAGLTYTYPTMKLFVPLFSGLIFLIYFKNFWRQFLVCGSVFGAFVFPIYYLTLKFPEVYNARYDSQSLTQSGETMLGGFLARFWEYWTPYFLTGEGDPNKMQQVNGFGSIPESLLILIYLGIGVLLWRVWRDLVIFCKEKFKFKKENLAKLKIENQNFGQNLKNKKQESSLELSPKIDVESDLESGELEKQTQLQKAQKQFSFIDSVQILSTKKSLVLLSALLLSPVAASLTKDHFMSTRAVQMLVMAVIMSGIGFWFVRINLVIWALKLGNLASIFENHENQLKYYFNKNHENLEINKKKTENSYNSWKSEIKNQNNNFSAPDFEPNKTNQNTEIGKTESQNYSKLNPVFSQFPNQFLRFLINQIETFGQFLSLILLLVLSFQTIHFSSFYFGKFRVEQRASFQFGLLEMYDFLYQNEANFETVEIDGVNQPYIYHLFWAKPTNYDTKIMTSLIGKYRFGSVERFDLESYPLMYSLKDVDDSNKIWVKVYAKTPRNWVAVR